jgi:hypothetical protein
LRQEHDENTRAKHQWQSEKEAQFANQQAAGV